MLNTCDTQASGAIKSLGELSKFDLRLAQECLASALQKHTGARSDWPVDQLAFATGISKERIYAYRLGRATPPMHDLFRLVAVLGPNFLNDLLAPTDIGGAFKLNDDALCPLIAARAASEFVTTVLEHASDGQFDHRELAVQRSMAGYLRSLLGRRLGQGAGR